MTDLDKVSQAIGRFGAQIDGLSQEFREFRTENREHHDRTNERLSALEGCAPTVRTAVAEWMAIKRRGMKFIAGAGLVGLGAGTAAEGKTGWFKALWAWVFGS